MGTLTSEETLNRIAEELSDATYGAPEIFELADGRLLRAKMEPDTDADIRDDEFFGTFSEYAYDYSRDDGKNRPDEMDGNAEKLPCDRGSFVWWQPPKDGPTRGTPEFQELRRVVLDILECGYVGIIVELCDGEDAYGRPIVREEASLWGIDAISAWGDYGREVIRELLAEIGLADDDEPRDPETR